MLRALTDRFLPPGGDVHQLRMTLLYVWMGIGFTGGFAALYAAAGSPIAGLADLVVTLALVGTLFAIRRGVSVARIGNAVVAATWGATAVVAARSGGSASPVLVSVLLFPIVTYAPCGARAAAIWAVLGCLLVVAFWLAAMLGVSFAQDLAPGTVAALRVACYLGDLAAVMLALAIVAAERRASFAAAEVASREIERARILDDVHDGVGAQLVGVLVAVRAGELERQGVLAALESCIDDLRLVVSSEAARDGDLPTAIAEVRARFASRFDAAGAGATWAIADELPRLGGATTLQATRALQEMLTNALRHAGGAPVEVRVATEDADLVVFVRDFGPGFDPAAPSSRGRGLRSLRARARRLGGSFVAERLETGARVTLRVPLSPERRP